MQAENEQAAEGTAEEIPEVPEGAGTLVEVPDSTRDVTQAQRYRWSPDQYEAIRQLVIGGNPQATPADLNAFLEITARYGLDPFARHAWLARMNGKNTILIGRDGLQHIAQKSGDLVRNESGVVYEGDQYRHWHGPDGWEVEHISSGGTGTPRGAWAIVERRGQAPYFFWAPYAEYVPKDPSKNAWGTYKTAMIGKVAASNALRLAYNVAGVVAADEVGATYGNAGSLGDGIVNGSREQSGPISDDQMNWPSDEALAARLRQLIESARAARQGAMAPARVRMQLANCQERSDYLSFGEELVKWHQAHSVPIPEKPVDATAEEE